jgi:predicted Zn-dependent peptidase
MPLFCVGVKDTDQPKESVSLAKKQAEMDIILELLFGKSGDFYNSLYESGLINSAFSASYEGHVSFGFCEISGYSNEPDKVYEKILERIEEVRHTGFDKDDFERVKRVFYASNIRSFNSTDDIANGFISCLFKGYDMLSYPEYISSVTLSDIERRFTDTFVESKIVLSKILPLD